MKIGMVCPYSFDYPGGVQRHIIDLASALIAQGHQVSVLAPGDDGGDFPDFVVPTGRSVPIRYNGSVARLSFGPAPYRRVRRWIRSGQFEVLHLHEPAAPSLSMLALMMAEGPIVATFHTANARSRMLAAFQGVLQPFLEKISGRVAVSELARRVQVDHLDGDAVVIPNGVDTSLFATAPPYDGYPRDGGTIGFVGRFAEPRKGMPTLVDAMRALVRERPNLRLLVAGVGDEADLLRLAGPEVHPHVQVLGRVSEYDKARILRSVDVFCAPNLGGESFGIVLGEAMAAGAPVVASNLDSFRHVLADGQAGVLVPPGDALALADSVAELLADPARRERLGRAAQAAVAQYDWTVIAPTIVKVYETVAATDPHTRVEAL